MFHETIRLRKAQRHTVPSKFMNSQRLKFSVPLFISILSHVIGLQEKTQFFLFNILISVFLQCLHCAVNSLPSLSLSPRVPSHWRGTISAQIQREMNLGFMKRKASYKKKKVPQTLRDKLSYNGFSPVSLQSLSRFLSEPSDSDGCALFSSVGRHILLWSAAGKVLRRTVCSEVSG